MKKLTISDFKGDHFDAIQIIEEIFSFDIKNPRKTLVEVLEATNDCTSIVEAIFYKKEKMKRGIDGQKDMILQELCKELKKEVENIHLNEIGNTFFILEQKKSINELERIKKVLKYSLQMEGQMDQILEALIKSDSIEEWMFLAEIIYVHTNFSKSKNLDLFNSYSKKLEEKISNHFEKALSSNDAVLCKACFDILSTLDKEFTLIDSFLMAKDLFTPKMVVHPPMITKIDLHCKEEKSNTFITFLDETRKILEDNFNFICLIFGHKDEYVDYILSKIYRTLISISLGDFLNVSNPPIFLICLQSAFSAVKSFGQSIKCLFQKFDYLSCADDIFSRFLFTATLKEKQLFDEILEIFILGTKMVNTYYISGEKVEKSNNFVFIYERMLVLLDTFMTRSETICSKSHQKEVLDAFSVKMIILVEKMVVFYKSKLELINDLIYMYLCNCKFFGDRGESFFKFNEKIKESIANEFEEQIRFSIQFMKNEISNMFFTSEDCHKRLQKYIENLFINDGRMGDKNFKLFAFRISEALYELLYKQLQFFEITEERLKRIHVCLDDVFLGLPISCSSEFLVKSNFLKSFTKSVVMEQSKFLEMVANNKNMFTEAEMKYLIKCRTRKTLSKEEGVKSKRHNK